MKNIGSDERERICLINKRRYGRGCEGYFTVEATLVYPFVIGAILLVIYIWFFLYDRCLMEQDFAGVIVSGAVRQELKPEDRIKAIEDDIKTLYEKQYLFWSYNKKDVSMNNGKIEVTVEGSLEFPFKGLNFWNGDNVWGATREYSGKTYDRIFIIRTFRKIEGFCG